jgi:hypothetical protein
MHLFSHQMHLKNSSLADGNTQNEPRHLRQNLIWLIHSLRSALDMNAQRNVYASQSQIELFMQHTAPICQEGDLIFLLRSVGSNKTMLYILLSERARPYIFI